VGGWGGCIRFWRFCPREGGEGRWGLGGMWDRGWGDLGLVDCGACIGERGVEKV